MPIQSKRTIIARHRFNIIGTIAWVLAACCATSSVTFAADRPHTQRIITLAPHLTDMIVELGIASRLVGVSAHSDRSAGIDKVPEVADHRSVNYELITHLNPDLILAWRLGNKQTAIARLKDLGYKVYVSAPSTFEDIAKDLRNIAELTGRQSIANKKSTAFLERMQQLKTSARTPTVKVLYLVWDRPPMTLESDHFIAQSIEWCGAQNLYRQAGQAAITLNREALFVMRPDLVIHSLENRDSKLIDELFGKPVKSLYIDGERLQQPSLGISEGVAELCAAVAASAIRRD